MKYTWSCFFWKLFGKQTSINISKVQKGNSHKVAGFMAKEKNLSLYQPDSYHILSYRPTLLKKA
jgi:hypothetical protein